MKTPSGTKTSARERIERVYGLAAARSVFFGRPDSVLSIVHTRELRSELREMLREAARRRIAYREVEAEELGSMAGSIHHEGVCLLVRPPPPPSLSEITARVREQGLVIALDGVQNPHNVGAILRSAAYFEVAALVIADEARSLVTPAARRVAEGGADVVPVLHVPALAPALASLEGEGFTLLGADARAKLRLSELRWPLRSVLVLGHERSGLSPAARKACKTLVRIEGGSAVDSLNVSVAAGIFMASFAGAHGPPA